MLLCISDVFLGVRLFKFHWYHHCDVSLGAVADLKRVHLPMGSALMQPLPDAGTEHEPLRLNPRSIGAEAIRLGLAAEMRLAACTHLWWLLPIVAIAMLLDRRKVDKTAASPQLFFRSCRHLQPLCRAFRDPSEQRYRFLAPYTLNWKIQFVSTKCAK